MKKRSISSQIIFDTARDMWYKVDMINENKNLFSVSDKNKEVIFKSTDCGINTSLSLKLCDDKELTYDMLEKNNIRTAKSIYLNKNNISNFDVKKASITFPLVVKPLDLWHGDWVYTEIKDETELNLAIERCLAFSNNIIIQEHIYGHEHRILVIWDNVIFWARRINAHVIGNGKNTIKDLIENENNNPLRWDWYDKPMSFIKVDEKLMNYIQKHYNYTLEDKPKQGEVVTLIWVSNIWAGGTIDNVTEELGEWFKKECVKIAKSLWLWIAGIDIITRDLSIPLDESRWIVLEVGATPWFGGFWEATNTNPAKELLNFVFNQWNK